MALRASILDQVRTLVAPLSAEERLELIRTIAQFEPVVEPSEREKRREKLRAEQASWFARTAQERARYKDKYVAVHQGRIVGHDRDQRTLYRRIRQQFDHEAVLIISANLEAPREFTVRRPQLDE